MALIYNKAQRGCKERGYFIKLGLGIQFHLIKVMSSMTRMLDYFSIFGHLKK